MSSSDTVRPHAAELWETAKMLVIAVLAATFIHSFLFEPFYVPSGSMVPSLLVGDYLVVDKFAYGYSHFSLPFGVDLFQGRIFGRMPKRGDVVVFRAPNAHGEDFIKRLIGLPGDTIQVTNGQLYINGALAPRQDDGAYTDTSDGGPVMTERFIETLPNGKTHAILKETDDGFANNTPAYAVPPGDVFMMGDNRDNSYDSRFMDGPVGYVPMANLIGPARLVLGSMDLTAPLYALWSWPAEIRWGRMFHRIS